MTAASDTAPEWGVTTYFDVEEPDEDGNREGPWWGEIVLPPRKGKQHHGSTGSVLPDTVVVRPRGGAPVALADPFAYVLENQYCVDGEYYLLVRVREVLDEDGWGALPWGHLGPGDVFYAWDKFHHHEYSRADGAAEREPMSYGGDFRDLQLLVDADHPHPAGPRPVGGVCDASLLRAVRHNDLDLVRRLLAAGADPDAGLEVPDEAIRSVSWDRDSTALAEAVSESGARGDGVTDETRATAREIARDLLAAGANPDARGGAARRLAERLGGEIAALLAAHPPRP